MTRALLLNASFEPLCVLPARRAVVLVLKRKAEIVERDDEVFHSERTDVPVPRVLRLNTYVRVPFRSSVPLSRRAVFARDQSRCQYCGNGAENLDHVLPRSRGGTHSWDNVVASCRPCNARKEDRLPSECGMHLRRAPVAQHASMWVVATAGHLDPAWARYLGAEAEEWLGRTAVPA